MVSEPKLKSCPFCGSGKVRMSVRKTPAAFKCTGRDIDVFCEDCGIGVELGWYGWGVTLKRAKEIAIKMYNRRDGSP